MTPEEFRPEKALLIILGATKYPQHETYNSMFKLEVDNILIY